MDVLCSSAAVTPLFLIGIHSLLTYAPSPAREPLLLWLSHYASPSIIATGTKVLQWIAILALARYASRALSDVAENNFRLRSERHRYHWPDEIAIVTGGTGGFGSLICKSLASHGLSVICVDIAQSAPVDMQSISNIHYYRCNVSDPAAVTDFAKKVKSSHGHPSILINNAGIAFDHEALDETPETLEKMYGVNVFSHYYMLREFLPNMITERKGHVIALASMASFIVQAKLSSYSGSKAAVLALHEALQQECRVIHNAPEVKFTVVHPTFADTALVRQFKTQLNAANAQIISPTDVSGAIVNQILRCRGGQIVLGGRTQWICTIRAWPQWLQQLLIMVFTDGDIRKGIALAKGRKAGDR